MNSLAVLKGILLILALTMDSFVVSFAYGVSKTKMPFGIVGLAFILSLDSIAVGIGTGLVQSGQVMLVIGSFLAGIAVMEAGWMLGHGTRHILNRDLSWLSGVCLLLLAIGSLRG